MEINNINNTETKPETTSGTTPEPQNYSTINTPIQNMVEDSKRDGKMGPLIGSIVIILIFIVGALYFWGSIITRKQAELEAEQELQDQVTADSQINVETTPLQ